MILITPSVYYGVMLDILKEKRATDLETTHLDDGSIVVHALVPWQEVVGDMNDQVDYCRIC